MKLFKKISAIAASVLMLGMTAGVAAAANYPAPFVVGGTADVAIVYGANSPGMLDYVPSASINVDLQSRMIGGGGGEATTTGGDSYKIELASTKFQLGKGVLDVISGTVTDDNLPTLLADGKYRDSDNNEKDYTQKLTLANWSLGMFDDSDYARNTPTIGVRIASGSSVLNYTLDFSDDPAWDKIVSTDMNIMGKTYYVLSVGSSNQTMTLLDAATRATINEGETKELTVGDKTYTVSAPIFGSSTVKLVVNGETTTSLSTGQTYRLSDGTYVGIKELVIQNWQQGLKQAEFSIGSGRLILTHNQDVQMNDDTISRLRAHITNTTTGTLDKLAIEWKADGDLFIAPDSEPVMPGFGAVKLVWGEMTYPKQEVIGVEYGGSDYLVLKNFPLKDGKADISFLYGNSTNYTTVGKDSDEILRTVGSGDLTFTEGTDEYFVASWTDGSANAESYIMRAANWKIVSNENRTTLQYYKDGSWTSARIDAKATDTLTLGNVVLTIGAVNYNDRTVVVSPSSTVNFKTLYSKEGLKVLLPWVNETAVNIVNVTTYANAAAACTASGGVGVVAGQLGHNRAITYNLTSTNASTTGTCVNLPATYNLVFYEEDRNGNVGNSNQFNLTAGFNSATTPEVSITAVSGAGASFAEQGDTKIWVSHVYSPLATQLTWDKSGDQYIAEATYHGAESYGNVFVASPEVSVTPGITPGVGQLGDIVVKDTEVSSVQNKHLIVVGGSCINSVAANLVGGAYCGSAWTDATEIGSGQFLIQSFGDAYTTGKIALLVAGYEATDTVNAATYLRTKTVITVAGKKYKGTSSTSAELVVA